MRLLIHFTLAGLLGGITAHAGILTDSWEFWAVAIIFTVGCFNFRGIK